MGVCEKVDRRNVREHWQKKVERAQVGVQWPRAQYCAEIGALLTKSFTLSNTFVIFLLLFPAFISNFSAFSLNLARGGCSHEPLQWWPANGTPV